MPVILTDKYLLALRLIQPARIQDIISKVLEIWPESEADITISALRVVHEKMRSDGHLVPVRRGTYVLTQEGMEVVARMRKERDIDNARMFLMKAQRKRYHRVARRLG